MVTVSSGNEADPSDRGSRWVIALAMYWIAAVAAFAFALHQFLLKFLYDQSTYTRTPGGILMILLGFLGIGLPIVLQRNRRWFRSRRPSRQWLVAAGLPIVYLLLLAGCLEASHRSTTTLLSRPFPPTAVVRYRPGDSRVEFRGGWRTDIGPRGYNDAEVRPDGSEEFSSYLAEGFIRRALEVRETVAIVGRAKRENDGTVRITLDVDAKEPIRIAIANLDDVTILRDGRPFAESQLQSGRFQVTITGRPK